MASSYRKNELIRQINEYSFVLDEMRLFLDTHPQCKEGIMYYNEYVEKRNEVVAEYQRLYGPLNYYELSDEESWQWVSEPWPWEAGC